MNGIEYRRWISSKLSINEEMLQLNKEECRKIGLSQDEIIELTEKAMIAYSKREVEMPNKIGLHPLENTMMHAMPAYVPSENVSGMKWVSVFPENQKRFGYSQTTAIVLLCDSESGSPICLMDGAYLTEVRTAAVAVAAAKKVANTDAKTLGMIGCGVQGSAQVSMIERALPELETIYVIAKPSSPIDEFIAKQQPKVKAKLVKAKSYEELAKSSEVILSASIVKKPEPQIMDAWISAGQTIILTDGHTHFDDAIMKRADKYILDSPDQVKIMLHNYPYGLPKIYAETGEVLGGIKKGRENKNELIVVNNTGMAVEDMLIAKRIFDIALKQGIGRRIKL